MKDLCNVLKEHSQHVVAVTQCSAFVHTNTMVTLGPKRCHCILFVGNTQPCNHNTSHGPHRWTTHQVFSWCLTLASHPCWCLHGKAHPQLLLLPHRFLRGLSHFSEWVILVLNYQTHYSTSDSNDQYESTYMAEDVHNSDVKVMESLLVSHTTTSTLGLAADIKHSKGICSIPWPHLHCLNLPICTVNWSGIWQQMWSTLLTQSCGGTSATSLILTWIIWH